jgi:hypothetical protein
MTKAHCPYCKKIIIKNWELFLKEDPFKYIQCCYCKRHINKKQIQNEINKEINERI